tara:strand:+ start:303 stop:1295 length:993 start_codon:yes stop_codon:yes gene_type:complete
MKGFKMAKRVVVIGGGAWGSAMAKVLIENGHEVCLWCYLQEEADAIAKGDSLRLPDVEIPSTLTATTSLQDALATNPDYIVVALSSSHLAVLEGLVTDYNTEVPLIVLTKGFAQPDQPTLVSDEINGILSPQHLIMLSGPNLAKEIALQKQSASVIAGKSPEILDAVKALISNDYLTIQTSEDLIGVQLGGVLKNVIAIAAGMVDGLGYGNNFKSALVTLGLSEMIVIGERFGARKETFYGLSGLGDLMTTCHSELSRNWQFGNALTSGKPVQEIVAQLSQVTEGIKTAAIVHDIQKKQSLNLPIMSMVYQVIYDSLPPKSAMERVMASQ